MAQRGWLYVLIGLLISSFLGGAVHVFLSPERVRGFVEALLTEKQPKFNIEFTSAKLQLANGIWPAFAVELDGLVFRAKNPCITNSTLHIDQLIVPFELRSFFSNKLRFGNVHAGRVQFFIRPQTCKAKVGEIAVTDEFMSLERFFQKRWSKEVVNTTRYLDEFSVEELQILRDNQGLAPVVVKDLDMKFLADKGESQARFEIHLGEPWVGSEQVGGIKTEVLVRSDSVTAQGRSNLKEGQFQIAAEWAVDRGDINFKLFSQDMPAQNVLNIMHHWSLLPGLNPTLKNQWLNCDMSLQGTIRDFWSLPIELHQCRLYGELGEMLVKTSKIESLSAGGPIQMQIQDLDVRQVLSDLGLQKHWLLVSQYGHFSGELKLFNRQAYDVIGDIRNAEIYGVGTSGQLHQKIERMALKINYDGSRFSGGADNFVIGTGEINGAVNFTFTPMGNGEFSANFPQFALPVALQKVLWGGVLNNVSLKAQGEMTESTVTLLNADVLIGEYQTHQWSAKKLKLAARFQNDVWGLNTRAESFALKPESKWRTFFLNLFSFVVTIDRTRIGEYKLHDLSGDLVVNEGGRQGTWSKWRALAVDKKSVFRSEGQWAHGEGVTGVVQAQYPGRAVNWVVSGDWSMPLIKSAAGL